MYKNAQVSIGNLNKKWDVELHVDLIARLRNFSRTALSPTIITHEAPPLSEKIHNLPKKSASQSPLHIARASPVSTPGKTQVRKFDNKGSFTCYFCFGKGCYYEDWRNHPEPAIRGLFSDFITPYVIASQRLSNRLIEEYKIIDQFKELKVKAVVNLEEPGEHPKCGDGIDAATGFSYNPETLSKNGVMYYNFGWEDMGVPELKTMLNIVKVMDSVISMGCKVLVHCHAGMGRTGLAIGCYMLYSGEYQDIDKVIKLVKSKRKKAFDTDKQIKFIKVFSQLLGDLRILFPEKVEQRAKLEEYLIKQNHLLHGVKKKKLRNCPIIVSETCERLCLMYKRGLASGASIAAAVIGKCHNVEEIEVQIRNLKQQLNKWDWTSFYNCEDPIVIVQTMLDFLDELALPAIDQDHMPERDKPKFTAHEIDIMKSLVKVCRLIMSEEVDYKSQDTVVYRLAITLLGVRGKESKCFLNRALIDWDFNNSLLIEHMKEYFETLLNTEGVNTPYKEAARSEKATLEALSPESLASPSIKKIDRSIGMEEYNQFTMNLAKLPNEEQMECFQRFDQLLRDVESRSTIQARSLAATPVGSYKKPYETIRKSGFIDTSRYFS